MVLDTQKFTPLSPPPYPQQSTSCTSSMPETAVYDENGTQLLTPELEAGAASRLPQSWTVGHTIAPTWSTLCDLERIARLGADWDSYGSAPPSSEAVKAARRVIGTVYQEALLSARNPALPYSVAPLSGGGVQLEWRGENKAIEIQVSADGGLGYLLVKGAEPSCAYEEADGIPESRILELVRSVQR
jgi:hypothetical protein